MAKVGWSDPAKAGPMIAKIAMGRFAGKFLSSLTLRAVCTNVDQS